MNENELRQKSSEEEQRLRIGERGERPLLKQRSACSSLRGSTNVDADRWRAPDLDTEPYEVSATDPFHDRQPHQRSLEQRTDSEHGKRDDSDDRRPIRVEYAAVEQGAYSYIDNHADAASGEYRKRAQAHDDRPRPRAGAARRRVRAAHVATLRRDEGAGRRGGRARRDA